MKSRTSHSVDAIFVVLVFLLFVFSAVSALLLGVNFYRKTVDQGNSTSDKRTATAYIREIVRQHDTNGAISVGSFDGNDALVIEISEDFELYVYFYEGNLYELTTKKSSSLHAKDGQIIMSLNSFNIEQKDNVLIVNTTDTQGVMENVIIGITSKEAD